MTGVNRLLAASTAVAFALLAWVLWLDDDCSCPAVPPASSSTTTTNEPHPSSSLIPPVSSSRSEPEPASPVPASGGLTG